MEKWEIKYCQAFVEYLRYVNTIASHSYVWHDTISLYSRITRFLKESVCNVEYKFSIHCYNFVGTVVNRNIRAWVDSEGNLKFLEGDEVIPIEEYSAVEIIAIIAVLKTFFNMEQGIWLPDTADSFMAGINDVDNINSFVNRHFVMPMVTIDGKLVEMVNWHRFYMR